MTPLELLDFVHRVGWPPIAIGVLAAYLEFLAAVFRKANHRHTRFFVAPHPLHRGGQHSARDAHRVKAEKRHALRPAEAAPKTTPAMTVRRAA